MSCICVSSWCMSHFEIIQDEYSLYPECPSDQPLHWDFWELLVWCTCKCQVSPYARSIFTQVVIFHSQWTNRIQRAVSAHVTVLSLLVKALQSDVRRSDLDLQHSFLKCHPHSFFLTDTHFVLVSCQGVFLNPEPLMRGPSLRKSRKWCIQNAVHYVHTRR